MNTLVVRSLLIRNLFLKKKENLKTDPSVKSVCLVACSLFLNWI